MPTDLREKEGRKILLLVSGENEDRDEQEPAEERYERHFLRLSRSRSRSLSL